MQIVVAAYGSRGDVEPCAAVALELLRRDHDVRMAVPPNLLGFIESAGLAGVAYGPDSREEWNPGSDLVHNIAPRMQNPISVVPEVVEHVTQVKVQKGAELSALAKGADLVLASFNGALTLELPTDTDDEVLSWIAAGTPPVYFGLGSTPITSPADTFAMISAACAQLGERVLICSGPNDATNIEHSDHVKLVDAVNHSAIFPTCRAVVHHGGAGTTAAGLRAGIPTLILWLWLDQPLWAAAVQQLEVGFGRRFSDTSVETLVADLRLLLSPQYAVQAHEIAVRMTKPAESLAKAADLLEETARQG
jgi:UDP:flavonoid glycosyltransferase YjiC (YdhE family)